MLYKKPKSTKITNETLIKLSKSIDKLAQAIMTFNKHKGLCIEDPEDAVKENKVTNKKSINKNNK